MSPTRKRVIVGVVALVLGAALLAWQRRPPVMTLVVDLQAGLFVRLVRKVPGESQFQSKDHEPWQAISLLYYGVKPPESMLREYLKPTLQGTNLDQIQFATMALQQLGFQVIPE